MNIDDVTAHAEQAAYTEATGCYHPTVDVARHHAQLAADITGEAMEITLTPQGRHSRYSVDPNPTGIQTVGPLVQHIEFVEPTS